METLAAFQERLVLFVSTQPQHISDLTTTVGDVLASSPHHVNAIVQSLDSRMARLPVGDRQICVWYLCDSLVKRLRHERVHFCNTLEPLIPTWFSQTLPSASLRVRGSLFRMLKTWRDKRVFAIPACDRFATSFDGHLSDEQRLVALQSSSKDATRKRTHEDAGLSCSVGTGDGYTLVPSAAKETKQTVDESGVMGQMRQLLSAFPVSPQRPATTESTAAPYLNRLPNEFPTPTYQAPPVSLPRPPSVDVLSLARHIADNPLVQEQVRRSSSPLASPYAYTPTLSPPAVVQHSYNHSPAPHSTTFCAQLPVQQHQHHPQQQFQQHHHQQYLPQQQNHQQQALPFLYPQQQPTFAFHQPPPPIFAPPPPLASFPEERASLSPENARHFSFARLSPPLRVALPQAPPTMWELERVDHKPTLSALYSNWRCKTCGFRACSKNHLMDHLNDVHYPEFLRRNRENAAAKKKRQTSGVPATEQSSDLFQHEQTEQPTTSCFRWYATTLD